MKATPLKFNPQARKRHVNINFFVRLVPVFTGFVPGTNPVRPWDKSGEKQGSTQEFFLFYTVEARFHRVCPWDKPGLSRDNPLGQERRRTKVSRIFRIFVPNFAPNFAPNFPRIFRGLFVLRFVGDGDQKKFTKNPRHFSMQNSQANMKKIFTKFFWGAGKVQSRDEGRHRKLM